MADSRADYPYGTDYAYGSGARAGSGSTFGDFRPRMVSWSSSPYAPSPTNFQFHHDQYRGLSGTAAVQEMFSRSAKAVIRRRTASGAPDAPAPKYRDQTNRSHRQSSSRVSIRGGLGSLPFDRLAVNMLSHCNNLTGFYSVKMDTEVAGLVKEALRDRATEHRFFEQLADATGSVGFGRLSFKSSERMRLDSRTYIFVIQTSDSEDPGLPLTKQIQHRLTSDGILSGWSFAEVPYAAGNPDGKSSNSYTSFRSPRDQKTQSPPSPQPQLQALHSPQSQHSQSQDGSEEPVVVDHPPPSTPSEDDETLESIPA